MLNVKRLKASQYNALNACMGNKGMFQLIVMLSLVINSFSVCK